jgi:hypothetical protein
LGSSFSPSLFEVEQLETSKKSEKVPKIANLLNLIIK